MFRKRVLGVALALMMGLTGLAGLAACNKGRGGSSSSAQPEKEPLAPADVYTYDTSVRQGYAVEYLGEVPRKIPNETKNEGMSEKYPVYGSTASLTGEEKNAILAENKMLCGKATTNTGGMYDKIDKDGKLYVISGGVPVPYTNGDGTQRTLYKHTASVGMYGGNVSDEEKAVVKRITFAPRGYSSYSVTGLYAPAGEVVKLEMSEADFAATGGVTVHVGQALYNGQSNNIWAAKNFNRMPVILNTLLFNASTAEYDADAHTYTCYIGSYLGGPIYIRNTAKPVTITFSGAVNYRHLIYGLTTEEEFAKLSESTAPYFDLEVWDNGVLQSGPAYAVKNFSYEDLFNAAVLWDKISSISTQISKQGIVFLFDPFVAAGAAVAFPGRSSVNCPVGWMANALNYEGFIKSGSWGNIHEYNHNFQGWGLPDGGEVTNNALNLVAYAQHTDISALRTMTASGESGLSGWNAYTLSSWALNQVKARKRGAGTNQLCIYATLLHNIGCENFVRSAGTNGTTNYFNKLCTVTGYDMSYFFKDLISYDPGDVAVNAVAAKNLPKFVPVGCVYQTGRSILTPEGDKKIIKTMRPYHIVYGEEIDLDLSPYTLNANNLYESGTIVLPEGFSYTVKSVSAPANGSIRHKAGQVYTYTPGTELLSGEIKVTLQITKDDNAFKVEDIDLIIELKQTHEMKKSMLERTVYEFDAETYQKYPTAADAFEANFKGAINKREEDNVNRVQNSNTDIWEPNPNRNAFLVVSGKLYASESGDYRVALRGRHSAALFVSLDGGRTYTKAADINHNTNKNDWWTTEDGYCDLENLKAGDWVYFKAVLKADYNAAFIGLGWGRFEVRGTIDEEGNFVDENGNPIDEAEARSVTLSYANGYRCSYQFPETEFTSEYLFRKTASYTYDNTVGYPDRGTLVTSSGFTPWDNTTALDNLFDGDDNNKIHSAKSKGGEYDITKENPFDITVDLGREITATTMTIYGVSNQASYLPKEFVLYAGTDEEALKVIATVTDSTVSNANVVVTFEEETFRYYRLVCTATHISETNPTGSKYIAFRCIKFSYPYRYSNGKLLALDSADVTLRGNWSTEYGASSFGRKLVAEEGSTAEFTFTGSLLLLLQEPSAAQADVTVYIDGKEMPDVPAGVNPQEKGLAFHSGMLESGEHTVKIVCNSPLTLDGIAWW